MTGEKTNPRITRLTPLDNVLAAMQALIAPVPPRVVACAAALGRVAAQDVVAAAPMPAGPIALRDGFAVRAEDIADAGPYAPVSLPLPQRVDLGEPLPGGADAVLPFDAVIEIAGQLVATAACAPGEGVLPAGTDLAAGQAIARAGRRLNAFDLAMLRSAGVAQIAVRESQVVLLACRRDDPIIDAARELLRELLHAAGCCVRSAQDLPAALAGSEDAVIAIGGTGDGRGDDSVAQLAQAGRVIAHGIAIAPGDTTAVGVVGARAVLLLPGRVDAALASWLTIGAPLIVRLSGGDEPPVAMTARLARKVSSPIGLSEVVPVRLRGSIAEPIASGYWPLAMLPQADGWILVPAASEGFAEGSEVVIRRWP